MPQLWRIDGDRLCLDLHPGQTRAWNSRRRIVAMLAGSQGGKTSFGPWWLFREIYGMDGYPGQGAGDYIAATASYDLFKLKMLPETRAVFEHVLGRGRYWAGDKVLELATPEGKFLARRSSDRMWGRVILRSASSPGGLEAATAKGAWLDECGQDSFILEAWEAILRRLALAQARALLTTTLYNVGWLKNQIYDPWRDGDPGIEVVQFASVINPAYPREEFERARRTMPGWRFSMFYLGRFAQPAGLIYGDFTDDMLVDPFAIPPDWPRVVGVDFGGANNAVVYLAQNPSTGIWYAYKETLEGGLSSEEHAQKALNNLAGVNEWEAVGGSPSEGQGRLDWTAGGFSLQQPPISGLEAGISRVIGLIRTDRFRVFRTLKGLRDELGSYRRKLDDAGQPTEEIVDKRKYHRLDALRYAGTLIAEGTMAEYGPSPTAGYRG